MASKKAKTLDYAQASNGTLKAATSSAASLKASHTRIVSGIKKIITKYATKFRSATVAVIVKSGRSDQILICSSRCAQGDTTWDRCFEDAMQKAVIKKTFEPESEFGGLDGELDVHSLSAAELLQRGEECGILARNQIRQLHELSNKIMKERKDADPKQKSSKPQDYQKHPEPIENEIEDDLEKEDDTEQVNGDCSDEDAALDGVVNIFRPDASIYRVPILHSDEEEEDADGEEVISPSRHAPNAAGAKDSGNEKRKTTVIRGYKAAKRPKMSFSRKQHVAQPSTGIAAPSATIAMLPHFVEAQTRVGHRTTATQEAVPMQSEELQGTLDTSAVAEPTVVVGLVAGEPEAAGSGGAGPSGLVAARRPRRDGAGTNTQLQKAGNILYDNEATIPTSSAAVAAAGLKKPRKPKLTEEEKEHLGTFAEEEHGKLYVVDKKADGYPQAVLQRMYALYEEGSEAHGHMLAALPDAKTLIARLDSILGRGYSKRFNHVVAAVEADSAAKEAIAAQEKADMGLNIGAPGVTADGATCVRWINTFREFNMRQSDNGEWSFLEGLTLQRAKDITSRVNFWLQRGQPSYKKQYEDFLRDMYGAALNSFQG